MQCIFEPHEAAMGFVRNKSIVDNAKHHIGSRYIYNIDLKDFFPSISQGRVWKCLQIKPFNLNDIGVEIESKLAFEISSFADILAAIDPSHLKIINSPKGKYLHLLKTVEGIERYFTIKFGEGVILQGITVEDNLRHLMVNSNDFEVYYGETKNRNWATLKPKKTEHLNKKLITSSRLSISNLISSICCTEIEVERRDKLGDWKLVKLSVLPQGAPTSPVITNIVCQRLDFILTGVAKRFGLKYSRYADDITFSSMHNVYQQEGDFLKELHRIIVEQGFLIKQSKTRLQKEGYRKEVTGLLVNEKVNVQHRYIKQLRMWLYYWERYGYDRACEIFLQQYMSEKLYVKGKPDMGSVIGGKLDYLKMVKGANNELYVKLKTRYDYLIGRFDSITSIIDIWEQKGIETAMNKFYPNIVNLEKEKDELIQGGDELKSREKPINSFDLVEMDDLVYPSDQPILTVIARWHSFEQKSYVRRIQDLSYV